MSVKGHPPWWAAPPAMSLSSGNIGRINSSVAFVAMVEAIVNSKDASDEEICESLRGLLDNISDKDDDKDGKHERDDRGPTVEAAVQRPDGNNDDNDAGCLLLRCNNSWPSSSSSSGFVRRIVVRDSDVSNGRT